MNLLTKLIKSGDIAVYGSPKELSDFYWIINQVEDNDFSDYYAYSFRRDKKYLTQDILHPVQVNVSRVLDLWDWRVVNKIY